MSSETISVELVEDLYSLIAPGFFATCWEGHDELEETWIRWAKQDYRHIVADAQENPVLVEERVRESGDECMAGFLNDLSGDLCREALSLIVSYLEDHAEDGGGAVRDEIEDIIVALS